MNDPRNPLVPVDSASGLDRRRFLQLAGAGGLVIAIGPGGIRRLDAAETLGSDTAAPWEAVAYVTLHPDGSVAIVCHRSEMGQGIRTTMPMIIADEMEADWAQCRVVQADGDDKKYGSQNTDGSTSIRDFLPRYREAGATVRALLEDAAAKEWGVAASEVKAQQHTVVHAATGRTLTFAALVPAARTLAMPAKERLRVKSPAERRWQGKKMPSIDLVPMTTGTARFGADVILPGMKTAVIARPPVWGATVATLDDAAARKVAGVERVVRFPDFPVPGGYMPLGGVAVVAANTWAALQGRKALAITWKPGPNAGYDSKSYKEDARSLRARGGEARPHARRRRQRRSAPPHGTISAEYYLPHLSHAQMEPVVAVAQVKDGLVEVWAPTQSPQDARAAIAACLEVGHREGHRARDAPRRRLRPQVQARLRLRGRLAGARGRRPGARAVDARGRPAEQLLPHRRRAPPRSRAGRRGSGRRLAPPLGLSGDLRHLRARHPGPGRRRPHQRRERHPVRDPEPEHRGLPRRGAHPHRLVPLGERHPPRLCHRLVRRRAGAGRRQGPAGVPAGARRARPPGGSLQGGAGPRRRATTAPRGPTIRWTRPAASAC